MSGRVWLVIVLVLLIILSLTVAVGWKGGPRKGDLQSLQRAANRGDAVAQFMLDVKYNNGDGVQRDSRQAAAWFRMAADQGLPEAQHNLAVMYDQGNGVAKDSH